MDNENYAISDRIKFGPVRSLGKFLTNTSFELPAFNDLQKWNKRVVTNMLYFQTNYFIIFFMLFTLVAAFYSSDVALGVFAVAIALVTYLFAFTSDNRIRSFRSERPYVALTVMVVAGCYCIYSLGSVLVLIFAITLPLLPIFVHASLHIRSLSAKVNLELENLRFRDTVMAKLLSALDIPLK